MNTHPRMVTAAVANALVTARRGAVGVVAASALGTGLALAGAPTAAADQQFDENWFVEMAPSSNLHIVPGKESQAIQLAYLFCKADKLGIDPAAYVGPAVTTRSMLQLAKTAGLCKYVSVGGQTAGADPSALLDINQKISDSTLEGAGIAIESTEGRNPATGGSVNPYLPCAQRDAC